MKNNETYLIVISIINYGIWYGCNVFANDESGIIGELISYYAPNIKDDF